MKYRKYNLCYFYIKAKNIQEKQSRGIEQDKSAPSAIYCMRAILSRSQKSVLFSFRGAYSQKSMLRTAIDVTLKCHVTNWFYYTKAEILRTHPWD